MAKFTATVPLNLRLPGGFEASGAAGTVHRIPDSLVEEFTRDQVPNIPGGVTWITQDEESGTRQGRNVARTATLGAAVNSAPVFIAHRGWARCYPENTMASFKGAIAGGARVVETDCVFDAYGNVMISHDTTIDRTVATYSGPQSNYTANQLAKMDAGSVYSDTFSTEGVPSLHDVLGTLGDRATWILEAKATLGGSFHSAASAIVSVVHEYHLEDYAVIACFSDISQSTASAYGIPLLRYTGGLGADGSISGSSPSTLYSQGYRYVGTAFDDANLAAGAAALALWGIKVFVYTAAARAERDVALAAHTNVVGVLTNDFAWLDSTKTISLTVGSTLLMGPGKVIPSGVVPFYNNGSGKAEDVAAESWQIGWVSGRLGYPLVDSTSNQRCMVLGPLAWGAAGLGKLSADITVEATTASTRFAGLACYSNDRGHVSGGSTDTGVGYEGVIRQSGVLEIFRFDSAGAEVSIGTATSSAALTLSATYTVTFEITASNVILIANGTTLTVADATYRTMTYPGLIRSQLGVSFANVKRIT